MSTPRKFSAMIEKGMANRFVTVEATSLSLAYSEARMLCESDEYVRGVNEIEEKDRT